MGPRLREDTEGHPHPNLPPSKGEGVLRGMGPRIREDTEGLEVVEGGGVGGEDLLALVLGDVGKAALYVLAGVGPG